MRKQKSSLLQNVVYALIHDHAVGLLLGISLFLFGLPFFALPEYFAALRQDAYLHEITHHLIFFTWNTQIFGMNIYVHHTIMVVGTALFIHAAFDLLGKLRRQPVTWMIFGIVLSALVFVQVFVISSMDFFSYLHESARSDPGGYGVLYILFTPIYLLYFGGIFAVVGGGLYGIIRLLKQTVDPMLSYRFIRRFGVILLIYAFEWSAFENGMIIIAGSLIIALFVVVWLLIGERETPLEKRKRDMMEDDLPMPLFDDEPVKAKRSSAQ